MNGGLLFSRVKGRKDQKTNGRRGQRTQGNKKLPNGCG